MFYREFIPNKLLCPYIRAYWILGIDSVDTFENGRIVLPDACCFVVLNLKSIPIVKYSKGIYKYFSVKLNDGFYGADSKSVNLIPTGETLTFGLDFFPWSSYCFLNKDIKKSVGQYINMEDFFGKDLVKQIFELKQLSEPDEIVNRLNNILSELYINTNRKVENDNSVDAIRSLIRTIWTYNGIIKVSELADFGKISERTIERLFDKFLVITPKKYIQIVRLNSFVFNYFHSKHKSLATIVHNTDYYDQPHFCREFKSFTGITPLEFLKHKDSLEIYYLNRKNMSDFYNTMSNFNNTLDK